MCVCVCVCVCACACVCVCVCSEDKERDVEEEEKGVIIKLEGLLSTSFQHQVSLRTGPRGINSHCNSMQAVHRRTQGVCLVTQVAYTS